MLIRFSIATVLAATAGFASAAPVDINCADAAALAGGLKGVGDAKAKAIIAFRSEKGLFKSADDLTQVTGIGPKTVEENRADIQISESCAAPEKP